MAEKKEFTYKESGVDIEAGEELVHSIKEMVRETHGTEVLGDIGSFGGFFKPDLSGLRDPVFVSSVDGVGTKLIVAFKTNRFDTVGQDLVNHCVNDIAVCGATPLFFLDYFSTGNLKQEVGYEVVKGFSIACKQNGVALIGGETAEMPDIYQPGEFDLAGTVVGVVDENEIITGDQIDKGDLVIGFASSGLHTNGYSLARKVLFSKYDVNDHVDSLGMTVGDELLKIHRSYLQVINGLKKVSGVNGFAHITGGGIEGNTKRVLGDELGLDIEWNSWKRPEIFNLIQRIGNVPEDDMRATFNLGIGLVAVVHPEAVNEIKNWADDHDEKIYRIGKIR